MNGDLGKKYLKDYFEKTDSLFLDFLNEKIRETKKNDVLIADVLSRFTQIARKGKKIRGALVSLGYEACGKKLTKDILDTSLFVELFHAAILAQDDIQDRGNLRRGIPTLHRQVAEIGKKMDITVDGYHYGESIAMDTFVAVYFYSIDKLIRSNFSDRIILDTLGIYSKYAQRVTDGQTLDITGVSSRSTDEKYVLKMLQLKSAEYTGVMPLLCGASLAGEKDPKKLRALREYGLSLGWAFQIQDDILGIYAKEEEIGKPVGSDIKEGKNTLFIYHLSKNGTKEQIAFMKKVLGNSSATKNDIQKLKQILIDAGSYDFVVKKGWDYVKKGLKVVPKITNNKRLSKIFESLIYYMMERTL